jgi:hypothetical protein
LCKFALLDLAFLCEFIGKPGKQAKDLTMSFFPRASSQPEKETKALTKQRRTALAQDHFGISDMHTFGQQLHEWKKRERKKTNPSKELGRLTSGAPLNLSAMLM